jgi:hypothetical protein
MPHGQDASDFGDLHIKYSVIYPESLDEHQKSGK